MNVADLPNRMPKWVEIDSNGCWLWTGALDENGYAITSLNGKTKKGHRVAYLHIVGEIPEGLVLDHLCSVRRCVFPGHLEAVTQGENIRRGNTGKHHSSKTHCKWGHPFSGDNLIVTAKQRRCRTCDRARYSKAA